jgi:uroporphyrinogen-III synthase
VSSGRDLAGRVVILTRQREDNVALASLLAERGAIVIELPCVRTEPLEDGSELLSALRALGPDDALVLTSRAGARAVAAALAGQGHRCGLAVVGNATRAECEALGLTVSFVASTPDGRSLASELPLPSGDVLLARSDLADAELPRILRARGARVREVVAYRTVPGIDGDPSEVVRSLRSEDVTIVVASPSAVGALATLGQATLRAASFVAIGPRTAERVRREIGARVIAAGGTDATAILAAMAQPHEEVPA